MGHDDQRTPTADSSLDRYYDLDPDGRLRVLAELYQQSEGSQRRFFEGRIVELTGDMQEHPEWFGELEIPCFCNECRSNA